MGYKENRDIATSLGYLVDKFDFERSTQFPHISENSKMAYLIMIEVVNFVGLL